MEVISLINEKGGVGKTTIAIHVAAGLAIRGQRVLLIDADGQGHATYGLGLEKEPCFYDMLVRKAKWKDILRPLAPESYESPLTPSKGLLAVLPGNTETMLVSQRLDNALAIRTRLNELREVFDIVIFDTSPTPSLLHGVIYMATDAVLYPTECEPYSLQALGSTYRNLESFSEERRQTTGEGVETIGIIPTMFKGTTVEHSENYKELQAAFGDLVLEPLVNRMTWVEAASRRIPVFRYAPKSQAAKDAWRLVDRVSAYVQQA
jgi:chromosome partitioning protein